MNENKSLKKPCLTYDVNQVLKAIHSLYYYDFEYLLLHNSLSWPFVAVKNSLKQL